MIAQLGERQTEHPKIPGSNPGRGMKFIILLVWLIVSCFIHFNILKKKNSITLVAVLNNAFSATVHSFFYKNVFDKNIEAKICKSYEHLLFGGGGAVYYFGEGGVSPPQVVGIFYFFRSKCL